MDAETVTKKHPIRGALYGLSLGIGVAVYLIIFAIVEFSATTSIARLSRVCSSASCGAVRTGEETQGCAADEDGARDGADHGRRGLRYRR